MLNKLASMKSRRGRKLGTLVCGILVGFSLPPWGWWPLAILGIAVFFAISNATTSTRELFALGMLFAAPWFSLGMSWMWWLTAPGYLIVVFLFATLHGIAAAVAGRVGNPVLSRPIAHCLAEALRFSVPFGGVPLATIPIAISQTWLASIATLGGPVLTTWFVLQAAATIRAHFDHRESRPTVFCLAVALGCLILLALNISPVKNTGENLRLAIVQGGGPQGVLAINTRARDAVDRHLAVTKTLEVGDQLDAVLWPENVIDVAKFVSSVEYEEILAEARRLNAEFIVGITEDAGPNQFTNAQLVVRPTGEINSRYDKVRRAPFGEYVPVGLRRVLSAIGAPMDQVPNDAVAGNEPAILEVKGEKVAVVISWEAFFAGRANSGVEAGGQVLLNPTNGSTFTGTVLQTQQLAANSLRTRETGRYVVQAATTGFSALIEPSGRITNRVPIGVGQTSIIDVPLRTGRTVYSIIGDGPFIAGLLIALFAIVLVKTRKPANV